MEIKQALKEIFKEKNFILMFLVFCIGGGAAIVYSVQLPEMVAPEGYSDYQGGIFGSGKSILFNFVLFLFYFYLYLFFIFIFYLYLIYYIFFFNKNLAWIGKKNSN